MKLNKLISIGLCSLLFSSIAFADDDGKGKKGGKPKRSFEKVDTDKDGKVSLAEYTAGAKDEAKAKARFEKKDKDKDGFLSKKEYSKHKKGPKKPKKDDA